MKTTRLKTTFQIMKSYDNNLISYIPFKLKYEVKTNNKKLSHQKDKEFYVLLCPGSLQNCINV